jgi:hypothetical protein
MNNSQGNPVGEKKSYRVLLLLIVGLAAFSSAMNELNQIQDLTLRAGKLIAAWSDVVVPTASASGPLISTSCVPNAVPQSISQSDEFRWSGNVAPGATIEVKGINGEIVAEAANGSDVEVIAVKRSQRSDVNSVHMKVEQHAGGVTICALYPNEDGEYPTECGRDGDNDSERRESSSSGNVRNNDVKVDFRVRVPARVGFIGKTINGGISATALTGNVITRTINGSIKISTSGYGEATTINGEIAAKLGDANWPKALSFKTINGGISLDLPGNVSTSFDAQTLNGSINSDFPLKVISIEGRKHVRGTIGSGGRELLLKTLNGSINLRMAG